VLRGIGFAHPLRETQGSFRFARSVPSAPSTDASSHRVPSKSDAQPAEPGDALPARACSVVLGKCAPVKKVEKSSPHPLTGKRLSDIVLSTKWGTPQKGGVR